MSSQNCRKLNLMTNFLCRPFDASTVLSNRRLRDLDFYYYYYYYVNLIIYEYPSYWRCRLHRLAYLS